MIPYDSFETSTAERGFTLLETIVALSVLLAALIGPVSLIVRGLTDFTASKNKLIAAHLAQEGIELIRLIRDNNIACDQLNGGAIWPWNQDPETKTPINPNSLYAPDVNSFVTIDCGSGAIATPRLPISTDQKLRYEPSTGIYSYDGRNETNFIRRVRIQIPQGDPDGIPSDDQMDVIAHIEWQEGGFIKQLTLQTRLYNWR